MKGPAPSRHQVGVSHPIAAHPARAGEDGARPGASLADLYRAHAQDVARWARRLGGPLVDVEDVVQEVFLVAHHKLSGFRHEASYATWLFRITWNVARHRRRKDRLRTWLTGTAEAQAERAHPEAPGPEERLEQQDSARRLYRVLDQLPERSRTVLVLFELEGMSGQQIAGLLDARVATVWVWLHRARADFLKRMRTLEAEEAP